MSFLVQASASVALAVLSALPIDWAMERGDDGELGDDVESDWTIVDELNWTIVDAVSSTEDESESDQSESESEGESESEDMTTPSSSVAIVSEVKLDGVDSEEASIAAVEQDPESQRPRVGCLRRFALRDKLSRLSAKATAQAHGVVDRASYFATKAKPSREKRVGGSVDVRAGFKRLKGSVSGWKATKKQERDDGLTPMEASI